MIAELKSNIKELKFFLILLVTQTFSSLGTDVTNFALIIWSYQQKGSALTTSLLTVCSYAPYVLVSIFAGALSDRWNKKKTMLISDSFAALCTVVVLILLTTGRMRIWHLYIINALNGLMNSVQQPASEVTISLLTPKKYYQKVSGMRSFCKSLNTILKPVIATAMLTLTSLNVVIAFDLFTFAVAFIALLLFIKIPQVDNQEEASDTILQSAKSGLHYLKENRGILDLVLFLAIINFIASIFQAAMPALILSREYGGKVALGTVETVTGITNLIGSILVTTLPAPKKRARVICNCLLVSMSTNNFILALGRSTPVWCIGAFLGWILIPVMGGNMDVLFRSKIPVSMQGRVYSVRNTLQFFTIPLGYLLGGAMVDRVFEPFMARQSPGSMLTMIFGTGKGSGAAMLFLVIGFIGSVSCLPFRADKHIQRLDDEG